ncbi:hypothetical protein ZIOFF_073966 [Zingiber officinale]|uniref:F-box/LRR-repeat protein 15-like leucin rich repeat domain-containing protein n=1 Tax=Zingiber officinale TaxID=94328 RepID=A0A8J5EAM7_ZINOF|nr:hypothetical protein ZIOFF_073966 [Zingiber officinale]
MPILRSIAASLGSPPETLETTPPPSVEASADETIHSSRTSPAASSLFHQSSTEMDHSGATPPLRRSLRLASMSNASFVTDSPAVTNRGGRKNSLSSASKTTVEVEAPPTVCKADAEEIKVLEVPEGSPTLLNHKRKDFDDSVGGKYMCLRSGSKLARVGFDQMSGDTNEAQTEMLTSGPQRVHEGFSNGIDVDMVAENLEEKIGGERFSTQLKGKGILIEAVPEEQQAGKVNPTIENAEYENKGKGKLVEEEDLLSISAAEVDMDADAAVAKDVARYSGYANTSTRKSKRQNEYRKEVVRSRAIELAPKFAFFKPEDDKQEAEGQEDPEDLPPDANNEDWPGPFSTALKIIEDRNQKLRTRESNNYFKKGQNDKSRISWVPTKNRNPMARVPSTLRDLCVKILLENAEEIESLDGIPDLLKHWLILKLCHSRKMNPHLLSHLVSATPTEICLSDCSWLTEVQFENIFSQCDVKCLKLYGFIWLIMEGLAYYPVNRFICYVLQLDRCGRCLPDYVLRSTLAHYPNGLPSLTRLNLKGAYRLSDDGLNAVVASAPSLSSINLSECPLLTSMGIINLADKLGTVLTELYIDGCQNVDAMAILPALKKVNHLEVLSVGGLQSVCDKFVHQLIPICGSHMRELTLAGCEKLSNASIRTIGAHCCRLFAIDLQNLKRLNDSSIGYLANGCRSLQKLKLRRNAFSDEAIAAFLEASGGSLAELSLNNVAKLLVSQHILCHCSRSSADWGIVTIPRKGVAFLPTPMSSTSETALPTNQASIISTFGCITAVLVYVGVLFLFQHNVVAEQTALAISRRCCSTLYSLDLSFCREMTDEALGLIVDNCSSLRFLKLFGCTQVTEVFFNGHSNSSLKVIGPKGQLLDDSDMSLF